MREKKSIDIYHWHKLNLLHIPVQLFGAELALQA